MPAAIVNGRLCTKCETCGAPAHFGTGVSLTKAMAAKEAGKLEAAKRYFGIWHCSRHKGLIDERGGNS